MVTLDTLRAERREEILRLAGRRGAHSLRVFGSVARGEANENSDLDLLVAWRPITLFDANGRARPFRLETFHNRYEDLTLGWSIS